MTSAPENTADLASESAPASALADSAQEGAQDQNTADISNENSMTSGSFADLGLSNGVLKGLNELGYTAPTDVQREVFIPVREGNDVIVQSRTGSGKTTAFCLPMLCGLDDTLKSVQTLILCPTRELAVQVSTEASRLARFTDLKVVTIYGGASMRAQMDALDAGAQVVVGTPGRVKDLIRRGYLRMGDVKFAILDEADEMLSMGFWEEVTGILDQLPKARQTLLFSATLPAEVERAASIYLKEPSRIDLSTDSINVDTIRHLYIETDDSMDGLSKPRQFLYALEFHRPASAIVFCNRRDETELLTNYLRRFGYRAEALNGDMPQKARERVLKKVKAGELDLMIATDVAARGIDISDLGHVFNYDLPDFDEVYVHRVGRTGRIGNKGTAVSLVRGKYITHLGTLTRKFEVPFEKVMIPEEKEILWMQAERLALQLIEEADGVEVEQYRQVAESMLERGEMKEILAFLLRSHFSLKKAAPRPERQATDERSGRGRRNRSERRPHEEGRGRERDERRDERPQRQEEDPNAPANLYITLGADDGLADMRAMVTFLASQSGVDEGHFTGGGDVRDHSSHVEIDNEVADKVIESVNGKMREGEMAVSKAAALVKEAAFYAKEQTADEAEKPAAEGTQAKTEDAQAEDAQPEAPRPIRCERARPRRQRHRRPRRR